MNTETPKQSVSLKARVQKLGTALSGMIMPNIGAIIAWGLITAIFMAQGWFPVKHIAILIQPMLHYLLPLLIAYVGGRMVYEERGAVVGAIAVMGVIIGAKIPMFLGAMIMGPLGGWCMKKFDALFQDHIKSGFEMIYNNFSSGIIGMLLAIFGVYVINPLVVAGSNFMSMGVTWIMHIHMLPLANLFIEPAKVLFLNNAVGNGILVPLGIQQAASLGKSVLFLMESNPGPGLGILLAIMLFGKGNAKSSAPGAAIIEFFGGIHEIYFPYILMQPVLILAAMAGGVTGTFLFQVLGGGLKAAASPGSIISILLMTPRGGYIANLLGVGGACLVSFLVATLLLKTTKAKDDDLEAKQKQMEAMKAESKGQPMVSKEEAQQAVESYKDVRRIIFACDAGMGSSAMGASLLRDKAKKAGINDVPVTNTAVSRLKDEPGLLVITQNELAERARERTPQAMHVAVDNFLSSPKYDEVVTNLKAARQVEPAPTTLSQPSATPQQQKTADWQDVDFARVKEVDFIHTDQHRGTATMATQLFKEELQQAGKDVAVKRLALADLPDDDHHLVIVTPAAQRTLKLRATHVQVIVLPNLLDQEQLAAISQQF